MSRRVRGCWVLALLAMATSLVVSVSANRSSSAQAAAGGWPAAVETAQRPDQIVVHPDGAASVARCSWGGNPVENRDLTTHATSGARINSVTSLTHRITFCPPNAVMAKGGEAVGIESNANDTQQSVVAFRGGKRRWSVNVASGCSNPHEPAILRGMTAGPNGDIYLASEGCNGLMLLGITIDGRVKFRKALGASHGYGDEMQSQLFAYPAGLVAVQNPYPNEQPTVFRYFDYNGKEVLSRRYTLLSARGKRVSQWTVNADGTLFIAIERVDDQRSLPCRVQVVTDHVIKRPVGGKSTVYNVWPHCLKVGGIHATPQGGAVMTHEERTHSGVAPLLMLMSDGTLKPQQLQPTSPVFADNSHLTVRVGLGGTIMVHRTLTDAGGITFSEWLLMSGEGTVVSRYTSRALFNDEEPGNAFMTASSMSWAVDNGVLYAAMCQQQRPYGCNPGAAKLYRIPFVKASFDYLRGRVAGVKVPAVKLLDLVVLGDSFSSGEGVEPFDPETDKEGNRCHRSRLAYGPLLAQDAALPIRMQRFAACSGSKSSHLVGPGIYDGKVQIHAITKDTDVVVLTIGGNDVDFEAFALSCTIRLNLDPTGCTGGDAQVILGKITSRLDWSTSGGKEFQKRLRAVKQRIKEVGSNAKLYLMGYPRLIPESNSLVEPRCLQVMFGDAEGAVINTVTDRLNQALQLQARQAGIAFTSASGSNSRFQGRELCTADAYFNGPQLPKEYSYHPNAKGQQAYAQLMEGVLSRDPGL